MWQKIYSHNENNAKMKFTTLSLVTILIFIYELYIIHHYQVDDLSHTYVKSVENTYFGCKTYIIMLIARKGFMIFLVYSCQNYYNIMIA